MADLILQGDAVMIKEEVTKTNDQGKTVTVEQERILNINEYRAIFLTDEELLFLINEKLIEAKEEDKIFHERTFQRYKRKFVMRQAESEEEEKEDPIPSMDEEYFEQFCRLIKKHLINQKQKLFQSMFSPYKDWQKYAWIIERKFDEWNIKRKSESFNRDKPFPTEDNIYDEEYEDDQE